MKLLNRIASALALLAAFISCDEKNVIPPTPDAPQSYSLLLDAYRAGRTYTEITLKESGASILFYNEERVEISDLVIEDCTSRSPKVLALDEKKEWMLAGELMGIAYNESSSLDEAYPLYCYFTSDRLVVKLDNGNSFFLKKVEPRVKTLPVLRITTDGAKPINSKDVYVSGKLEIQNPDKMYADQDSFSATAQFKGRGNSTWGMPKKPYRIKLDSKAELFGIAASKNWALLADYADKSLLRNLTAMELSRICGFSWTPQMYKVELYLNNQYLGVYSLSEHKEVAKKKVNIDVDAGDVYLEIEQNQDETTCWWTEHSVPMMFSDPEVPSAELLKETKDFFSAFETALWNKEFDKVYKEYIDLDSFIDYYIVQELTKNIDGNLRKSTFITRKKGQKLVMYHLWDFDLTMGNCDYYDNGNNGPTGWWIKDRSYLGQYHGWYYRLFMDPAFVQKVKDRWNELYPLFCRVPDFIEEQASVLEKTGAADRNFQKWNILDKYVWPNYKVTGSYRGEVDWLKEFYSQRLQWLNTNINKL